MSDRNSSLAEGMEIDIDFPQDINTPEGSVTENYNWSEAELKIIDEHNVYHYEMTMYTDELRHNGPYANPPKKPKSNLNSIFKKTKKPKLSGLQLHEYLKKNVTNVEQINCPKVDEEKQNIANLEQTTQHLKNGYQLLKQVNSKTLATSLDFGDWLNFSFRLYKKEKYKGQITYTWNDYLEENVGIKEAYDRSLRSVAKMLKQYPKFRSVGLSFYEICKRKDAIINMLELEEEASIFWKEN